MNPRTRFIYPHFFYPDVPHTRRGGGGGRHAGSVGPRELGDAAAMAWRRSCADAIARCFADGRALRSVAAAAMENPLPVLPAGVDAIAR